MQFELSREELQILLDMVESRAADLHPMIRRSRVSAVTDELKHDLEDVKQLLERLRAAAEAEPSG